MADPLTLYAVVHHIEDAVEFSQSEEMAPKERIYWAVAAVAAVEEAFARRNAIYESLPYSARDKPDDYLVQWLREKMNEAITVIEALKDKQASEGSNEEKR